MCTFKILFHDYSSLTIDQRVKNINKTSRLKMTKNKLKVDDFYQKLI